MADDLRNILDQLAHGTRSVEDALPLIRGLSSDSFETLCDATLDHDRARRCGFPEVVFAERKTPEQTVEIVRALRARNPVTLITRTPPETAARLLETFPDAIHNTAARTVIVGTNPTPNEKAGRVLIIAAGTSDLPVAEEARETIRVMGVPVDLLTDVGVAGLHRLLAHKDAIQQADALVVVAGMEGALPSVVGGLVRVPVVAVPTSVGYGASFGGVAALLGMLNSCAAGVSVVNIDNGFGAGTVAARIALTGAHARTGSKGPA